jgi:hypothetical protein
MARSCVSALAQTQMIHSRHCVSVEGILRGGGVTWGRFPGAGSLTSLPRPSFRSAGEGPRPGQACKRCHVERSCAMGRVHWDATTKEACCTNCPSPLPSPPLSSPLLHHPPIPLPLPPTHFRSWPRECGLNPSLSAMAVTLAYACMCLLTCAGIRTGQIQRSECPEQS